MWNIFDGFYKEKKLGINLFINESLHQTKWKMEKSKKELERIESQNHTRYIYYVPNVKILPSIASRWQQIRIANTPIPIFFEIFAKIRPSIVYISIPFDSQRIAYAWPFLTENRYCARGGSLDNKTLIPRRSSCLRHRNKLRFIPREFPRNILFATPLEQPRDALYVTR